MAPVVSACRGLRCLVLARVRGRPRKAMESVTGAGTGRKDDPRRRTKVHAYEEEVIDEDQLPPDYWSLLSLLFSVLGLMLRVSKVPKDSACV